METKENTGSQIQQPVQNKQEKAHTPDGSEKKAVRRTRPAGAGKETGERPARPASSRRIAADRAAQQTADDRAAQSAKRQLTPEERARREARRAAAEKTAAQPARKTPAKKGKKAEEGYQPYKAANQRKKAQQKGKIKTFFSPQNPVLLFFQKVTDRGDVFAEDSEIAKKRKAQREAAKKKKQSRFDAPAVVYTQPQAFNRDRLVVQLITVIAIVLAFVMGLSVFFKVKVITISGAEVYSPWAVREASGIKEGDNLLTFGRARAAGQIEANLPYVKNVRIGIKLPDTVNIEIDEESVVYAIKSVEGIWWLINSEGKVVDMSNNSQAKNYTQVLGVTLSAPQKNQIGIATEDIPTETDPEGEYVPLTVTGAQRLNAALQILKALEANDIVGEAASVDVSRMEDIILWYGTRYQVNLGDVSQMEYKIACMCDAILQMSDYQTGILDISFTTWSDQVGYTPFQ